MGKFKIDTPDGKSFEIEAPEGATEEDVNGIIRQHLGGQFGNSAIETRAPARAPAAQDPENALLSDIGSGVAEMGRGVLEGGANVLDHAADWAQSGLNAIGETVGGGKWGDAINGGGKNDLTGQVAPAAEGMGTLRGIGNFVGESAALLPAAAMRGGALAQGAASGALLSNSDNALGVAKDAAIGAVGGAIGDTAMRGIASLAAPQLPGNVRTLLDEGVRLTTGQIAGQGGRLGRGIKRVEDIAATVPIIQGMVGGAQRRATEDLNRAAVNRALRPIGERLPGGTEAGHDAVAFAGDRLRAAYSDVLPRLSGGLDQTFQTRVNTIRQRARLPAEYDNLLDQAQAELGNAFQRSGPNGYYSGRTLRDASERLSDLATGWRRSDDPYTRMVGDITEQFRQQLHSLARRQNPRDAARLRDIDRGYASLVRVEKAAASPADGVASPAQYGAAVRNSDTSVRRRQSARGQALDQDLASAGQQVMTNNAAQGGSKDVNSLAMLAALGAGAVGGKVGALAGVGGLGAGAALYSQPVQAAIRGLMARQPGLTAQRAAQLLRYGARGAPILTAAATDDPSNPPPQ